MKHAREDYQHIQDPTLKIPYKEPVFLLRGQDVCAPAAVDAWCEAAKEKGVDHHMIEAARHQAAAMRSWQIDAGKVPDIESPAPAASPVFYDNPREEDWKRKRDREITLIKSMRQQLDVLLQTIKSAPISMEKSLTITKVQEGIMWLGMDLKRLNEPTPYPSSKDPSTGSKIEPTADGLKL